MKRTTTVEAGDGESPADESALDASATLARKPIVEGIFALDGGQQSARLQRAKG